MKFNEYAVLELVECPKSSSKDACEWEREWPELCTGLREEDGDGYQEMFDVHYLVDCALSTN